jgi:hypothetical protein
MSQGARACGAAVALGFGALAALEAACTPASVPDPRSAVAAYADAASRGDAAALYAMLSDASKQARSKESVKAMVDDERAELAEQAREVSRPDARVEAAARVRYADGEEAALELRDGRYGVTASGMLPGGAHTPEESLDQLRRVLARRSYPGLMRVLSATTRASMERDLRTLVDGLESPDSLPVQVTGDTAVVQIPGGHVVKLRRESGVWRIDDFD